MHVRGLSLLLATVFASLGVCSGQALDVRAQAPAVEPAIIRAVLRDFAIPMRTAREKPPRPLLTIFVINKSLFDCPTPAPLPLIPFTVMVKIPVRGCVTADVIPMARTEAARGSWGFDLAGDLPQKTRDSIVFDHLDVSGLERIVIGPKADLYQTRPFPLPFQMSRAAVRGKSALVVLQYAQLSTWLILLTDNGSGWTVTKTVAWGMS